MSIGDRYYITCTMLFIYRERRVTVKGRHTFLLATLMGLAAAAAALLTAAAADSALLMITALC